MWRLARLHHYGMNFTNWWGYNYDFIHPLVEGHRAIADMVLYALQVGRGAERAAAACNDVLVGWFCGCVCLCVCMCMLTWGVCVRACAHECTHVYACMCQDRCTLITTNTPPPPHTH